MIAAGDVTAVLVTRGDVDLEPVTAPLPFRRRVVWDNSKRTNLSVYGRYAALDEVETDVVYVQDDDCVVGDLAPLLAAYRDGEITANMPAKYRGRYSDSCLLGFGSLFRRDLPVAAFARFKARHPDRRAVILTACDVIFTALTPFRLVDLPCRDLPYFDAPDRMWRQAGHIHHRAMVLGLAREARDG